MIWLPIIYNYIIVALFVFALALIFFKRTRKWSIIPLAIALALNIMTQSVSLNLFEKKEQKGLTIMAYNMNSAGEYFKSVHKDPQTVVNFINKQGADVVILEECYAMYCEDAFHKLMIVNYPYVNLKHNGCPNWVYSKYPLGALEELWMVEDEEPRFVDALKRYDHKVVHERKNVTGMFVYTSKDSLYLITCHLTSNGYDTIRTEMGDKGWLEGLPRYTAAIKRATDERCREAQTIVDKASAIRSNGCKVVVAGDMNDVAGSRTIEAMQEDGILRNGWWEKGCGFGSTFHGLKPAHFRLDHVFHTDNIKLNGIRVVGQDYSDHDPIVAYFDITK